jgi:hypothetical protein
MRLQLFIDGVPHEIDSTNPELLGKWVIEIFSRVTYPTPDTLFEVRAMPSWVPDQVPDWITDSQFMAQVRVMSPRDLVDALVRQLNDWERAHDDGT